MNNIDKNKFIYKIITNQHTYLFAMIIFKDSYKN